MKTEIQPLIFGVKCSAHQRFTNWGHAGVKYFCEGKLVFLEHVWKTPLRTKVRQTAQHEGQQETNTSTEHLHGGVCRLMFTRDFIKHQVKEEIYQTAPPK